MKRTIIAPFDSLEKTLARADAVVLARVERNHSSLAMQINLAHFVCDCQILAVIKGDLRAESMVTLRLADPRIDGGDDAAFPEPFGNYLLFLRKLGKADARQGKETFATVIQEGATTRLSPELDYRKLAGGTPESRIQRAIADYRLWRKRQQRLEDRRLGLLDGSVKPTVL